MALSILHSFQSAIQDSAVAGLIKPSNWNAGHNLYMDQGRIVGRTTASPAVAHEIEPTGGLAMGNSQIYLTDTNAAGSYTYASITVDAKGRITAAQTGTNPADAVTAAQAAQAAAEAAAAAAAISADAFDDVYLGSYAANPTLDNDGNALVEGQLYWNSVANELRVYDGAAWQGYSPSGGSGITAVVEDTSPQLGGDLDLNGHTITGLATVAFSGAYADLSGKPTLGTAAAAATTDFATAAQGAKADTALQAEAIGVSLQGYDADLAAIAGLTPSNDDVIQRKAGAWTNRTIAQLVSDLGLASVYQPLDGDLTSIAALTTTAFGRGLLTEASAGTAFATIKIAATTSATGVVEKAVDAEVYAATADKFIAADHIETASAFVALTDAAPVAVDWDAGINFSLTVTADRQIGNPTNGQPGTWRTIRVQGNSATDRTITFGSQFGTGKPTITDCDSTKIYLLMIFCVTSSVFIVSAIDGSGP